MLSCNICGVENEEGIKTCRNCKGRLFVSEKLKKSAAEVYKLNSIGVLEIILSIITFVLPALGWIIGVVSFIVYLFKRPKIAYIFLIIAILSLVIWGLLIDMAESYLSKIQ